MYCNKQMNYAFFKSSQVFTSWVFLTFFSHLSQSGWLKNYTMHLHQSRKHAVATAAASYCVVRKVGVVELEPISVFFLYFSILRIYITHQSNL